tara:strand:+ start:639 stop:905 length:267 start_codon:yes stop_codon:yes gene_type:complete
LALRNQPGPHAKRCAVNCGDFTAAVFRMRPPVDSPKKLMKMLEEMFGKMKKLGEMLGKKLGKMLGNVEMLGKKVVGFPKKVDGFTKKS